jgi:hypothetical protein
VAAVVSAVVSAVVVSDVSGATVVSAATAVVGDESESSDPQAANVNMLRASREAVVRRWRIRRI